jgi:hypothetical protein
MECEWHDATYKGKGQLSPLRNDGIGERERVPFGMNPIVALSNFFSFRWHRDVNTGSA